MPRYRVVARKGGIGYGVATDSTAAKVYHALTNKPHQEPELVSSGPWTLKQAKAIAAELNERYEHESSSN